MGINTDKIYQYKQGDELFTPVNAVMPLIKYMPKNAWVWECAEKESLDGNITNEFRNNGIKVIPTSIYNKTNFLDCDIPEKITHIITNPPFSLKNEFIKRCYEIGIPFALLLPTNTIDTKYRFNFYKKYGLEILLFNKRINYIGSKNAAPFASAWFCWNVLPEKLVFEEI